MIDSLFIINKITKIIEFYRFLTLYNGKGGGGQSRIGEFLTRKNNWEDLFIVIIKLFIVIINRAVFFLNKEFLKC